MCVCDSLNRTSEIIYLWRKDDTSGLLDSMDHLLHWERSAYLLGVFTGGMWAVSPCSNRQITMLLSEQMAVSSSSPWDHGCPTWSGQLGLYVMINAQLVSLTCSTFKLLYKLVGYISSSRSSEACRPLVWSCRMEECPLRPVSRSHRAHKTRLYIRAVWGTASIYPPSMKASSFSVVSGGFLFFRPSQSV